MHTVTLQGQKNHSVSFKIISLVSRHQFWGVGSMEVLSFYGPVGECTDPTVFRPYWYLIEPDLSDHQLVMLKLKVVADERKSKNITCRKYTAMDLKSELKILTLYKTTSDDIE